MVNEKLFRALLVEEPAPGQVTRQIVNRSTGDLPQGEVLVRVEYSSLNYKDALSASGSKHGVTRRYPHTPGIDGAGVVEESNSPEFQPGEQVLFAAGVLLGVSAPGGYGQYVRGPAADFIPLPQGMTARESMAYGTAGFTAALSVDRLQKAGVTLEQGEILVTGATGGVGTIAVSILRKAGYTAVAATGKPQAADLLTRLGASRIIHRDEINDTSGRPLLHAHWAGAVDTVGGNFLSTALRSTLPGGAVTACGNAASPELPITVFPFILRGISLIGIDALRPAKPERERIWRKLANEWKVDLLDELVREVPLEGLEAEIAKILKGGQTGRVVVKL